MRTPSTPEQLYAWYEATQNDGEPQPAMVEDEPHCGFYYTRFVSRGPKIPVEIKCLQFLDENGELTEPEVLLAYVGHQRLPRAAVPIWTRLRPIPRSLFDELMREGREDTHRELTTKDLMVRP